MMFYVVAHRSATSIRVFGPKGFQSAPLKWGPFKTRAEASRAKESIQQHRCRTLNLKWAAIVDHGRSYVKVKVVTA